VAVFRGVPHDQGARVDLSNRFTGEMMKKFVFIYVGSMPSTPEVYEAWGKWFESISDKIVDSGNPFGVGVEVTTAGTKTLPTGADSITGYTIIKAESLEVAEEAARGCPSANGVRVYEALAM
jgi:ferredoxin